MNESHDLFDDFEKLPKKVLAVLNRYNLEDPTYLTLEKMLFELNLIGYTFEYYLDCVPFNLQKLTECPNQ